MKSKVLFIVASAIAGVILVSCEEKNPKISDYDYKYLNIRLSSEVICPLCGEVIHPYDIDPNNDGVIQLSETSAITGVYFKGTYKKGTEVLVGLIQNTEFFPNLEHIYVEYAINQDFLFNNEFPKLKCANIHIGDQRTASSFYVNLDFQISKGLSNAEMLRVDLRDALTHDASKNQTYLKFSQDKVIFPNLKVLELFHNEIHKYKNTESELDLSKMPLLENVTLQLYSLKSLDLTKNTNLTRLDCSNNKLTALDLGSNPNLTYLNIGNSGRFNIMEKGENNITELDLRNNLEIDSVITEDNDLFSLYLGENSKLRYLSLGQCSLREINLEKCKSLEYFYCMGLLNELNLRNCGNLKYLRIYAGFMTELDLSNNLMLEDVDLDLNDNHLKIIISSAQQDKEWVKQYENYDNIEFEVI